MGSRSCTFLGYHQLRPRLLLTLGLSLILAGNASAATPEPICNPTADYFLGNQDYPEAVRLHRLLIKEHPDNALAHYHLGFAEGMMGDSNEEIDQYQLAVRLGLKDWGLYLNLGRAELEEVQVGAALRAFQQAVGLEPQHAEGHFNLALAYEREGRLDAASAELSRSLTLDPSQTDARNMLAVVDAEEGKYADARSIWTELIKSQPNFAPAHANLEILDAASKRCTPHTHPGFESASAVMPR